MVRIPYVIATFCAGMLGWQGAHAAMPWPQELPMPRVGIIVAPLDGVLVDTDAISFAAWRKVLHDYNSYEDLALPTYAYLAGLSPESFVQEVVWAGSQAAYAQLVRAYYSTFNKLLTQVEQPAQEPMLATVQWLCEHKRMLHVRLAAIGYGSKSALRQRLTNLGLRHQFGTLVSNDGLVGGLESGASVSVERARLLEARWKLGTDAAHTLVITHNSVIAREAVQLGIHVMILPTVTNKQQWSHFELENVHSVQFNPSAESLRENIVECLRRMRSTSEVPLVKSGTVRGLELWSDESSSEDDSFPEHPCVGHLDYSDGDLDLDSDFGVGGW